MGDSVAAGETVFLITAVVVVVSLVSFLFLRLLPLRVVAPAPEASPWRLRAAGFLWGKQAVAEAFPSAFPQVLEPCSMAKTDVSFERLSLRRKALKPQRFAVGVLRTSDGYRLFHRHLLLTFFREHTWLRVFSAPAFTLTERVAVLANLLAWVFVLSIALNVPVENGRRHSYAAQYLAAFLANRDEPAGQRRGLVLFLSSLTVSITLPLVRRAAEFFFLSSARGAGAAVGTPPLRLEEPAFRSFRTGSSSQAQPAASPHSHFTYALSEAPAPTYEDAPSERPVFDPDDAFGHSATDPGYQPAPVTWSALRERGVTIPKGPRQTLVAVCLPDDDDEEDEPVAHRYQEHSAALPGGIDQANGGETDQHSATHRCQVYTLQPDSVRYRGHSAALPGGIDQANGGGDDTRETNQHSATHRCQEQLYFAGCDSSLPNLALCRPRMEEEQQPPASPVPVVGSYHEHAAVDDDEIEDLIADLYPEEPADLPRADDTARSDVLSPVQGVVSPGALSMQSPQSDRPASAGADDRHPPTPPPGGEQRQSTAGHGTDDGEQTQPSVPTSGFPSSTAEDAAEVLEPKRSSDQSRASWIPMGTRTSLTSSMKPVEARLQSADRLAPATPGTPSDPTGGGLALSGTEAKPPDHRPPRNWISMGTRTSLTSSMKPVEMRLQSEDRLVHVQPVVLDTEATTSDAEASDRRPSLTSSSKPVVTRVESEDSIAAPKEQAVPGVSSEVLMEYSASAETGLPRAGILEGYETLQLVDGDEEPDSVDTLQWRPVAPANTSPTGSTDGVHAYDEAPGLATKPEAFPPNAASPLPSSTEEGDAPGLSPGVGAAMKPEAFSPNAAPPPPSSTEEGNAPGLSRPGVGAAATPEAFPPNAPPPPSSTEEGVSPGLSGPGVGAATKPEAFPPNAAPPPSSSTEEGASPGLSGPGVGAATQPEAFPPNAAPPPPSSTEEKGAPSETMPPDARRHTPSPGDGTPASPRRESTAGGGQQPWAMRSYRPAASAAGGAGAGVADPASLTTEAPAPKSRASADSGGIPPPSPTMNAPGSPASDGSGQGGHDAGAPKRSASAASGGIPPPPAAASPGVLAGRSDEAPRVQDEPVETDAVPRAPQTPPPDRPGRSTPLVVHSPDACPKRPRASKHQRAGTQPREGKSPKRPRASSSRPPDKEQARSEQLSFSPPKPVDEHASLSRSWEGYQGLAAHPLYDDGGAGATERDNPPPRREGGLGSPGDCELAAGAELHPCSTSPGVPLTSAEGCALPIPDLTDPPPERAVNPLLFFAGKQSAQQSETQRAAFAADGPKKGLKLPGDVVAADTMYDAIADSVGFSIHELIMIAHTEDAHCRFLAGLSVKMSARLYASGVLPYSPPLVAAGLTSTAPVESVRGVVPGGMYPGATVGAILDDPSVALGRSVLSDEIRSAQLLRPTWRLACEAVVLLEFKLAAALFTLDLLTENPDLFSVLLGVSPPEDLHQACVMLVAGRHVGREWCLHYSTEIWGVKSEEEFAHDTAAHLFPQPSPKAGPGNLGGQPPAGETPGKVADSAWRRSSSRGGPRSGERERLISVNHAFARTVAGKSAAAGVQMQLATTIEHAGHGADSDEEDTGILTWKDGVEAVVADRDFLRASHIFRAAEHPRHTDPAFPVFCPDSGDRSFYGTIEYGRLVARHYALHQLGAPADRVSRAMLDQQKTEPWLPLRHFSYPPADRHRRNAAGEEPPPAADGRGRLRLLRNEYLTYVVNEKTSSAHFVQKHLFAGGESDQAGAWNGGKPAADDNEETGRNARRPPGGQPPPVFGELYVKPPGAGAAGERPRRARRFADWVRTRGGAMPEGTGTLLLPFEGLAAAARELKEGDHVVLLPGCYPPAELRGLHGTARLPVFFSPLGYRLALHRRGLPGPPSRADLSLTEGNPSGKPREHFVLTERSRFARCVFGGCPDGGSRDEVLKLFDCSNLRFDGFEFAGTAAAARVNTTLSHPVSFVNNYFPPGARAPAAVAHRPYGSPSRHASLNTVAPPSLRAAAPPLTLAPATGGARVLSLLRLPGFYARNPGALPPEYRVCGFAVCAAVHVVLMAGYWYVSSQRTSDERWERFVDGAVVLLIDAVAWQPAACLASVFFLFAGNNLQPMTSDYDPDELASPSKRHTAAWCAERDRTKADPEWTELSTASRRYFVALKAEHVKSLSVAAKHEKEVRAAGLQHKQQLLQAPPGAGRTARELSAATVLP
ncbi:hypothetical protein DIPPA_35070 [Diplonema papillatum]|nr:hypothetical protein DIPPA_35070 [Diplonema papillatum]